MYSLQFKKCIQYLFGQAWLAPPIGQSILLTAVMKEGLKQGLANPGIVVSY